ncbi:MAG: hypothetical protein WC148_05920 [Bacilli bacterium]|jgi:hypothetical protein
MEKNIKNFYLRGLIFGICLLGLTYLNIIVVACCNIALGAIFAVSLISAFFAPFSSIGMLIYLCLLVCAIALNWLTKKGKNHVNCYKAVIIFMLLSMILTISVGIAGFTNGIIAVSTTQNSAAGIVNIIFGVLEIGVGIWMLVFLALKGFKNEFYYVFTGEDKAAAIETKKE